MKLQVAIDRVSLERALKLVDAVKDVTDIVEVGTSLIKDYGMESVRQIRQLAPGLTILADIKTMDEGAYEFEAAYDAGADIATVMGAAAYGTIAACYEVALRRKRDIMVDLLETSAAKIAAFEQITQALYCVHLPKDGPQADIIEKVSGFCQAYPKLRRVAVAGGVTQDQIPLLARWPIEVCVVGSAVTGASDPHAAATLFNRAVKDEVGRLS